MAKAKAKVPEVKGVTKPEEAPKPERVGILIDVHFEGIVGTHKVHDKAPLHAANVKEAKEIFLRWVARADGIRGERCFHPLAGYGDIKVIDVKEQ